MVKATEDNCGNRIVITKDGVTLNGDKAGIAVVRRNQIEYKFVENCICIFFI